MIHSRVSLPDLLRPRRACLPTEQLEQCTASCVEIYLEQVVPRLEYAPAAEDSILAYALRLNHGRPGKSKNALPAYEMRSCEPCSLVRGGDKARSPGFDSQSLLRPMIMPNDIPESIKKKSEIYALLRNTPNSSAVEIINFVYKRRNFPSSLLNFLSSDL